MRIISGLTTINTNIIIYNILLLKEGISSVVYDFPCGVPGFDWSFLPLTLSSLVKRKYDRLLKLPLYWKLSLNGERFVLKEHVILVILIMVQELYFQLRPYWKTREKNVRRRKYGKGWQIYGKALDNWRTAKEICVWKMMLQRYEP